MCALKQTYSTFIKLTYVTFYYITLLVIYYILLRQLNCIVYNYIIIIWNMLSIYHCTSQKKQKTIVSTSPIWDPAASVALMPAENKTTSGDTWHAEHMVWAFNRISKAMFDAPGVKQYPVSYSYFGLVHNSDNSTYTPANQRMHDSNWRIKHHGFN